MACIQCQYQWCWLCGGQWSETHFATCSEFRKWWQDPPLLMIVLCLLSPITIPFMSLFALGAYGLSQEEDENSPYNPFLKLVILIILGLTSLIISPIIFVGVMIGAPVSLACMTCQAINNEPVQTELFVPLTLLYLVLMAIGIIIASAVGMLAGVLMLLSKVYIKLKKFCRTYIDTRPTYNSSW